MNRRVFLKNGSLAMLSLGFAPAFLTKSLVAARARRKVLVTVFQRGAVDGRQDATVRVRCCDTSQHDVFESTTYPLG